MLPGTRALGRGTHASAETQAYGFRGKGKDANSPMNLFIVTSSTRAWASRISSGSGLTSREQVSFSGCSSIVSPGFEHFGLQAMEGVSRERKNKTQWVSGSSD